MKKAEVVALARCMEMCVGLSCEMQFLAEGLANPEEIGLTPEALDAAGGVIGRQELLLYLDLAQERLGAFHRALETCLEGGEDE
jgi:hypothetical protein